MMVRSLLPMANEHLGGEHLGGEHLGVVVGKNELARIFIMQEKLPQAEEILVPIMINHQIMLRRIIL